MDAVKLDPNNYPAVWNEHRRLSILHDRCLERLMLELGVERVSELEAALLELRANSSADPHAARLYSEFLVLERDLAQAEEVFALASRLREASLTVDRDLVSIDC